MGKGRHFAVLSQFTLNRAGNLFHRLDLSGRAHAGHRQTNVHGRADTLVEQVRFQEDLTVGDRDHVGRNERGHVVALGFDDRQSGQRALAMVVVQLRRTFQQTGVQVENVARESFTSRRTTEQQGHLTVGHGLLGQIVIADHGVHGVVTEELAHRAAGERCQVLQRSSVGSGRGDNDGVIQRAGIFQGLHELGNGGALLADCNVDAIQLGVFIVGSVQRLLVQEGVENDRGFTGLTVTDDQLALTAANRDQGVDGFQAGGHRLVHGLARQNAGCLDVHAALFGGLDRAFAVDRVAERVDDAAQKALADWHFHDGAGPLDGVAFFNVTVGAEDNDTNVVGFQVQGHALDTTREFDHFTSLDLVQTINTGDTVTDGEHLTDFRNFGFLAKALDLVLEDCGDFRGPNIHQPTSFIANLSELSLVRSDVSIMREPTLTTRPPIRAGSTFATMFTDLPVEAERASFRAATCSSDRAAAEVTSAVSSPRCCASRVRNALIMSGRTKRRRLRAASFTKLAARPLMPALSRSAVSAASCSSTLNTGLFTRRTRSSLSAIMPSKAVRSRSTSAVTPSPSARSRRADA
ncbi:hypothetical protein SIAM614_03331 [Stappia aggregata IAM 12614]|uniref:Uncharacterized protein n=1 Tax=Roseibium aggregatum (strain ATCC 25650 / DSM 13394 / JCM 20685 / NBRC 16684 / NCIMB 2208 / IAM 12614 / B1) TaxID=384765 RepID=A0NUS5_ROSAI|nr:hypothetical protein SIAM614_03331 [Stappia aggregata IAM 12614] [Roseibium aggregatum IAM 12614]